MAKANPEAVICDGCKKPIDSGKPAECELSPHVKVKVHPNLRSSSYGFGYHHRIPPRDSCLDKAVLNNRRCITCGEEVHEASRVCDECQSTVDRARETKGQEVQWVAIDFSGAIPNTRELDGLEEFDWNNRLDAKLSDLLCQAAARSGRRRNSCFARGVPSSLPLICASHYHGGRTSATPAVEVTKSQMEALEEFFQLFTKLLEAQFKAGIRRGHSNLLRLASGEIGPTEFDGIKARDEKMSP